MYIKHLREKHLSYDYCPLLHCENDDFFSPIMLVFCSVRLIMILPVLLYRWNLKKKTRCVKLCETQMPPIMANIKNGQDHNDNNFDTSKKILSQEMTMYKMENLVSYFLFFITYFAHLWKQFKSINTHDTS